MQIDLDYLKKYHKDIIVIEDLEKIKSINPDKIPDNWKQIFLTVGFDIKKKAALILWEQAAKTNLRNTISYLYQHLVGIDLVFYNNRYSVLYTIKNSKGNVLYYEGRLNTPDQSLFKGNWLKFPPDIQKFYEIVHDGFFYYASQSMGLSPSENITYLDDLEWGILEDLKEPLQINLSASYGFFTNGLGAYVVIDTTNCKNNNATLWNAKKQPRYGINFWDVVDEWTVIGFEN